MLILTLFLFAIGLAILVFSSIWSLVVAFKSHVLWGLAVMFVPLANLVFLIKEWEEAKRPFCWGLVGVFFFLAGASTAPKTDGSFVAALMKTAGQPGDIPAKPEPAHGKLPGMFAAQKEAELKIRLVALQQKEADLLDRKAALDPKDRAGAAALTEEIKRYNAELQPVLEQLRQRPMTTSL